MALPGRNSPHHLIPHPKESSKNRTGRSTFRRGKKTMANFTNPAGLPPLAIATAVAFSITGAVLLALFTIACFQRHSLRFFRRLRNRFPHPPPPTASSSTANLIVPSRSEASASAMEEGRAPPRRRPDGDFELAHLGPWIRTTDRDSVANDAATLPDPSEFETNLGAPRAQPPTILRAAVASGSRIPRRKPVPAPAVSRPSSSEAGSEDKAKANRAKVKVVGKAKETKGNKAKIDKAKISKTQANKAATDNSKGKDKDTSAAAPAADDVEPTERVIYR